MEAGRAKPVPPPTARKQGRSVCSQVQPQVRASGISVGTGTEKARPGHQPIVQGWGLSQQDPWPSARRAATQQSYSSGGDWRAEVQCEAAPLGQKSALDMVSPWCFPADSPRGHPRKGTTLGCTGAELAPSSGTHNSSQCQPTTSL